MELLAPAGNMECLKAAVSSGADAVYFAGKSFGARSYADNFSDAEIRDAAMYCRLRNVKSYVTVNTLVFDKEQAELDDYIRVLAEAGIDGVIVQDLGVIESFKRICPDMEIHASTQMTVHNTAGVRTLEKLGIKRAVLARELSETEIRSISDNTDIELEVFVHGAMCMSYSGQCLMSSVLGGRSGNRGMCAQPCRLSYGAEKAMPKRAFLSLKDMSLIDHLDSLKNMKIASLKIEGRMKGTDYVSEVVRVYRECIDRGGRPNAEEKERLKRVFYRGGLIDGYFADKKGTDMFAFDKPDNPYKLNLGDIKSDACADRRTEVECTVVLSEGEKPQAELCGLGCRITYTGDIPLERAEKNPPDIDKIKTNICKTGGTAFVFGSPRIYINGNPFVPIRVINELRRGAIAALETEIAEKARKNYTNDPIIGNCENVINKLSFTASVRTLEQYKAIKDFPFKLIDVPIELIEGNPSVFEPDKERIVISTGIINNDEDMAELKDSVGRLKKGGYKNLRVENIDRLEENDGLLLYGGFRLNVTNSEALRSLSDLGINMLCISPELNLAQIRDIKKAVPIEAVIYGHLPLMITENCVMKNMKRCPCGGVGKMYDRKNKCFPILKDGRKCRNIILNSVPTYMGDKLDEIENAGISYGHLMFTVEDKEKADGVCQAYFNHAEYNDEYTRLHFYKGVLQR